MEIKPRRIFDQKNEQPKFYCFTFTRLKNNTVDLIFLQIGLNISFLKIRRCGKRWQTPQNHQAPPDNFTLCYVFHTSLDKSKLLAFFFRFIRFREDNDENPCVWPIRDFLSTLTIT